MKKITSLLSLIVLTACNVTWGPHDVNVEVSEGFTLTDRKGQAVEFASDLNTRMVGSYVANKKILTLSQTVDGKKQAFDFANVTFNRDTNELSGEQLTTGQNLAVNIKNTFVNEDVAQRSGWQSCTYYEQRPREVCRPHGRGNGRYHHDHGGFSDNCHTYWESYPVVGRELVEETITTRHYKIDGTVSQSIGVLGQLHANHSETDRRVVTLSPCR